MKKLALILFIPLIIIGNFCCNRNFKPPRSLYEYFEKVPESNLLYDTLEDDFYYEYHISAYISGDVITKSDAFIEATKIDKYQYLHGYYMFAPYGLIVLKNHFPSITYDSISIVNLGQRFLTLMDSNYLNAYNPYCGCYYKKFHLKIEVLYIDSIPQRIPLFLDCDGYREFIKKNSGRDYEVLRIPTYFITKVFDWREL